jgi:mannose-6-phosphate isomerase
MATTQEQSQPYPLLFEPILLEKVWGGRRLAGYAKHLPPAVNIGESWELTDLPATAAEGAGGASACSIIRNGALARRPLQDAMHAWGPALMGTARHHGRFPLLVKYLDAREHLSVQVHPSPAYCREHPEAHLKTESWYILDALPGSVIYKGVRPGVTRADFEAALATNDGQGVVHLMQAVPAIPGQCHNLPSGTIHALGAGVLVAEVQTPSDTTFRVYDWAREYNRKGRALHIPQSLACIQLEPARDATSCPEDATHAKLVTTGYFDIDEARLHQSAIWPLATQDDSERPHVLMLVQGAGTLYATTGRYSDIKLAKGDTALIPASLIRESAFIADTDATLLRTIVRGL